MAGVGNPAYATGSATYFNGSIYAFAPFFTASNIPNAGGYNAVQVYVLDPATLPACQNSFTLTPSLWIDKPFTLKNGIGAAVANGQIYLFLTGPSTGIQGVLSSSDGQNWSMVKTVNAPDYPIVHDAITFTDPKDGKTKFMVVASQVASTDYPLLPAVSIFDPETDTWGPVSPMPQDTLPNGTYGMHASAWFGSWNINWFSGPNQKWISWNSGNTDAYLHVLGTVWTGAIDFIVHWYFNPTTGSWILDQPYEYWPPVLGVDGGQNRTPVALGPGYMKNDRRGLYER